MSPLNQIGKKAALPGQPIVPPLINRSPLFLMAPTRAARIGTAIRIIAVSALLVMIYLVATRGLEALCFAILEVRNAVGTSGLLAIALGYGVLLAIPFMPGIELGLLLIVIFGAKGAIVAQIATLCGLAAAFSFGRRLSGRLNTIAPDQQPNLQYDFVEQLWIRCPSALAFLCGTRWRDALVRNRHLVLAISLNMPGNALVGGGGGIALFCGASGQFTWKSFLLTVALATAPIPFLVVAGQIDPDSLLESLQNDNFSLLGSRTKSWPGTEFSGPLLDRQR
jgi:hypothetical protein